MVFQNELPENGRVLRILHVISHYELGGAEKCTFELSRLFDGRVEMGIAAVLGNDSSAVGQNMTQEAKRKGIAVFNGVRLPWKLGGFLVAALRLRRIVREFRPDIVHLNTEIPEFAYVLSLSIDKSLKSIPIVRTIHNTVLWSRWERLGAWCESRLGDTPVVCVSSAVRESFQRWRSACGLKPVTSDSTIYNPITVPLTRERLLNSRIQKRDIRLLFAGRFEFQKGCDLLPEILRQIKVPPDTQLSLFIYGEGAENGLLSKLRDTPPPGWLVQLAPPLPNLVKLLPDFDILLFPSRFEGYGRLAAEAVLAGIPVAAFRLPVLSEIFPPDYPWLAPFNDNDVSGFADNVSDLLASLEDAQTIVDNARSLLSVKLDSEKTVLAYLKFYESLIK